MDTVIVLYKTDTWHSYNSRDLIGIATDKHAALELAKAQARKEGRKAGKEFNEDQTYNFLNIKQTQGYKGEGEFDWEEITINKLI